LKYNNLVFCNYF